MGGGIRELLRAAQEAEVRGDAASAIARLREAAAAYDSAGKRTRALAMLRHAQRLDPSRVDLADAISALEASAPEDTSAAPREEAMPGAHDRVLVDRGPTLADGSAQAWCSFCCRPDAEVGALVSGPAGAFVCRPCAVEASRLFEGAITDVAAGSRAADEANASVLRDLRAQASHDAAAAKVTVVDDVGGQASHVRGGASASAFREVRAQALHEAGTLAHARSEPEAAEEVLPAASVGDLTDADGDAAPELARVRDAVLQALGAGGRRILLVGPAGAGKTAVLEDVGRRRRGFFFSAATAPRSLPGDWLLILDVRELPDGASWAPALALLQHHEGAAIIAVRGTAVAPSVRLRGGGVDCAVPSTQALLSATAGALPLEIAEQIDVVVEVAALDVPALITVAARMLEDRGFAPPVIQRTAEVVAKVAHGSGRGIHEVRALVRRIPPGDWTVAKTTGKTARAGRTAATASGRTGARKKKR